jgi:hypothetical protein
MRILLEKYNIRYFPEIENELPSSPVKRIIISWTQLLDMFLAKLVKDGDNWSGSRKESNYKRKKQCTWRTHKNASYRN